ncbi:MAG: tRNA dihydrouridine(20/20a) synthase DusA [Vulcanimicrobiota bacterium]
MSYSLDLNRRICIAPMMGWTNRHARYFHRQLTRHALTYAEMLAPEAIVRGNRERWLRYSPGEHPVAFQLGGNQPRMLAAAARELERAGFDEINFNAGCPSKKGKTNPFGAHLIRHPQVVRQCVQEMLEAVSIPVSVKTRLGVDEQDSYDHLAEFVGQVKESGCRVFIVHARKAWLSGLSTRQNREVPPLRYDYVYRLKREFPDLSIVINGGVTDWSSAAEHLRHVDGVMIGRRAYKEPFWLAEVDRLFFGSSEPDPTPPEVMRRCLPYVEAELAGGTPLREIVRHMVGLYRAAPAASAFRRQLSIQGHARGADKAVYEEAIRIAERLSRPGRYRE